MENISVMTGIIMQIKKVEAKKAAKKDKDRQRDRRESRLELALCVTRMYAGRLLWALERQTGGQLCKCVCTYIHT